MKRSTKNIIACILIALCLGSMYFTMNHASKNTTIQNNFEQGIQQPQGGMQPGGMQGGMQQPQGDMNFPGNMQMPQENMQMPGMNMQQNPNQNIQMGQKQSLSTGTIVLLVVEGVILSACVIYLFMSKFNALTFNETFVNKDKMIICILSTILLTEAVVGTDVFLFNKFFTRSKDFIVEEEDEEEEYDEIDYGIVVNEEVIDLSKYNSNITLKGKKEYTLTGEFNHSVFIDSNDKVTVKLNNVTINSSETAAIANINTNEFVVYLEDGTVNKLTDGGYSEYDGCLYSNGHLTIEGNGTLYVNGKQDEGEGIATTDQGMTINSGTIYVESNDDGLNAGGDTGGMITINGGSVYVHASGDGIDSNNGLTINGGFVYSMGSAAGGDAGIDTDAGYSIHGGTVIGLGSDMLTPPSHDSKQLSISLSLEKTIEKGNKVTLIKENEEIISFEVDETFRTLVLSSSKLTKGNYELYVNEVKLMDIEL